MTLEKATIMLYRICPPNVACQANPPFVFYYHFTTTSSTLTSILTYENCYL